MLEGASPDGAVRQKGGSNMGGTGGFLQGWMLIFFMGAASYPSDRRSRKTFR